MTPATDSRHSLVKRALFTCHGHPLSGHAGRSKTLDRAKLLYYWPGIDRDTRIYVKACRHCQQYKPNQHKKCAGPYTPHNMTTPWEVMCIDQTSIKKSIQMDIGHY
uniref:RNA-directed DNA polymerase n=1 Tax=Strigamia maritima TaxID=126957 RepID=T1JJL1_STRMM